MYPLNDLVCSLLTTPFSAWKSEDQLDLINTERPTPLLLINTRKVYKDSKKSYAVHFRESWYINHSWLCGSHYKQKLFCWPCLLVNSKRSVWNYIGFDDFSNIHRALHKHETSVVHIKSSLNFKQLAVTNLGAEKSEVGSKFHAIRRKENIRLNRLFLKVVIDAILFTNKQELIMLENQNQASLIKKDNFKDLIELLISNHNFDEKTHFYEMHDKLERNYNAIRNDLTELISNFVDDFIVKDVQSAEFFSVLISDAVDITQTSRCSIVIRYFNRKECKLEERFWGFYGLSSYEDMEKFHDMLKHALKSFNQKATVISQSYDGAVVSGQLNELFVRMRKEAPSAVPLYNLSYDLNLVFQQSFKILPKCRIFFSNFNAMSSYFQQVSKQIRDPCSGENTNFEFDLKLLNLIVIQRQRLIHVFQQIVNDDQSDLSDVHVCAGFLNLINDFEFNFLAHVFNDLFQQLISWFKRLKSNVYNIENCITSVKAGADLLKQKREEIIFSKVFDEVVRILEIDDEKMIDKNKSLLELYHAIIDHLLSEIDTRFKNIGELKFVGLADSSRFEEYAKDFPLTEFKSLMNCYSSLFVKHNRLKNELKIVYMDEKFRGLNLQKIIQTLYRSDVGLIEAYRFFCLVASLPWSNIMKPDHWWKKMRNTRADISQKKISSMVKISKESEIFERFGMESFYDHVIEKFSMLKESQFDFNYRFDELRRETPFNAVNEDVFKSISTASATCGKKRKSEDIDEFKEELNPISVPSVKIEISEDGYESFKTEPLEMENDQEYESNHEYSLDSSGILENYDRESSSQDVLQESHFVAVNSNSDLSTISEVQHSSKRNTNNSFNIKLSDPLDSFFHSMAQSVKKMKTLNQIKVKKAVANVIAEFEMEEASLED